MKYLALFPPDNGWMPLRLRINGVFRDLSLFHEPRDGLRDLLGAVTRFLRRNETQEILLSLAGGEEVWRFESDGPKMRITATRRETGRRSFAASFRPLAFGQHLVDGIRKLRLSFGVAARWAHSFPSEELAALHPLVTGPDPIRGWWWELAEVAPDQEHLLLSFGDIQSPNPYVPIARVGPPVGFTCPVEFMVDPRGLAESRMIEFVWHTLDFYLIELENRDPFCYAKSRCNSFANAYGSVHWSYYPLGNRAPPRPGVVLLRAVS